MVSTCICDLDVVMMVCLLRVNQSMFISGDDS